MSNNRRRYETDQLPATTYEIYFSTPIPGTARNKPTQVLQKRYYQAANEKQATALVPEIRRQIERELGQPIYISGVTELNPNYVEPEPAYDEPAVEYDDTDDGYLEAEAEPERRGLVARFFLGR